jgi:hypothetical protein
LSAVLQASSVSSWNCRAKVMHHARDEAMVAFRRGASAMEALWFDALSI